MTFFQWPPGGAVTDALFLEHLEQTISSCKFKSALPFGGFRATFLYPYTLPFNILIQYNIGKVANPDRFKDK